MWASNRCRDKHPRTIEGSGAELVSSSNSSRRLPQSPPRLVSLPLPAPVGVARILDSSRPAPILTPTDRRRIAMAETRKLAAIMVTDIVGFSKLAGADEERILARLRALRSDLIDPAISVHHGRVVKRTGDGVLVEFRSVVD